MYRMRQKKTIPKKIKISRKQRSIFCCIFHQLTSRYISVRYVNFITILRPQTKLWLCEIESENYKKSILFYDKETGHVELRSNINSDSMCEMSTSCFYTRLGPFAEGQFCCINWVLVWSVVSYGSETWTLRQEDIRGL